MKYYYNLNIQKNVFTITFDQINVSLNKSIKIKCKIVLSPNILKVVYIKYKLLLLFLKSHIL